MLFFPPERHRPWFLQRCACANADDFALATASLRESLPTVARAFSAIDAVTGILPGIFLGYALYAEGIWKGDILIADLELEEMDASEIHANRLNAKEVILPKSGESWKFPVADGPVQPYGGDQGLRTSTLIPNQPVRGESRHDFLDESKGSPPTTYFQDSFPDAGEALDDFWSISGDFRYCHHVEPTVKLYTPREESFPTVTSPESLILPWMYCRKVVSMMIGTSMDQENCPIHGKISDNSPCLRESLQKDTCGLGETNETASNFQT